ncbi:MAG: glycosyltransferase family 2 protein [Armatimonadota bacterium]
MKYWKGLNMPVNMFSVIIKCEHSADFLAKTLKALINSNYDDDMEILVLDNGSKPEREKATAAAMSQGLNVRYLQTKGMSKITALNFASHEAKGNLLAFLDDDCIPPPNWLDAYNKSFDAWNIGIVGGPDKAPDDASIMQKCLDYVLSSTAGTLGARSGRVPGGKYYPRPWNMAARKESVLLAGGFDEDDKQAPEVPMIQRMGKIGYGASYQPDAVVGHYKETQITRFFMRDLLLSMERGRKTTQPGMSRLYNIAIIIIGLILTAFLIDNTYSLGIIMVTGVLYAYTAILALSGLHAVITTRNPIAFIIVPPMLILHHSAHFAGYLAGLLTRNLKK